MNILLIGNGFDLEHGLPTKYSDFLKFCDIITILATQFTPPNIPTTPESFESNYCDSWDTSENIKAIVLAVYIQKWLRNNPAHKELPFSDDEKIIDELSSLLVKNTWYNYFIRKLGRMGEHWIDLESEISTVIQSLDQARTPPPFIQSKMEQVLQSICASASFLDGTELYGKSYRISALTQILEIHLAHFIRALEIYISHFVKSVPIWERSPDIEAISPDHVLSFNYSDTYEQIYDNGKNIEYDYIHGKASINSTVDSCNLVLGIDEYLNSDKRNEDLDFIPFKKYYQRILKSTGSAYQDWISTIKKDHNAAMRNQHVYESMVSGSNQYSLTLGQLRRIPKHYLYIFGHSLDITDKDVLHNLICNDNIYTKIYYYREYKDDKRTLAGLIKNLVHIIGQDELIRRTGGSHKTIEFIPQTLHE